ncbi:MAG: PEGA domain-containing protein [Nitrospirae bacterium]|nr:PEGA domain-containing protein [Nitrospirota bacterium]
MKKSIIGSILLLVLSIGTIAEAGRTRVYSGSWFGWWGHPWIGISGRTDSGRFLVSTGFPYWWGYPGSDLFVSKRIDVHVLFGFPFPFFWNYDYRYYHSNVYYYPYNYRDYSRIIVKNPDTVKDSYNGGSGSYNPDVTRKDQDVIFYGGIQIHPAGRIKITTTKGDSGQPEVADIVINGLPAGKTGIGDKPFEMGLLIGKHKVSVKKDGKEVFSTEVNVERNKDVSLKIDLESLMSP